MDSRRLHQFNDNGKPPKKGRKGKGKRSKKKGRKSVGQGNGKPSKDETSRKSLGQRNEKTMDSRRMNQFDCNGEGTSRISDDESGIEDVMNSSRMNQFYDDNGKSSKKDRKTRSQGNGEGTSRISDDESGNGERTSRISDDESGNEKTMDSRRMNQSDGNGEESSRTSDDESEEDVVCGLWKGRGSGNKEWQSYVIWRSFLVHTDECFSSSEDFVPVMSSGDPHYSELKRFFGDPAIEKASPTTESLVEGTKKISLTSSDSDSETETETETEGEENDWMRIGQKVKWKPKT